MCLQLLSVCQLLLNHPVYKYFGYTVYIFDKLVVAPDIHICFCPCSLVGLHAIWCSRNVSSSTAELSSYVRTSIFLLPYKGCSSVGCWDLRSFVLLPLSLYHIHISKTVALFFERKAVALLPGYSCISICSEQLCCLRQPVNPLGRLVFVAHLLAFLCCVAGCRRC